MEGTSGESPSNFLFLDILPVVQNADKSATKKIRGLLGIFVLVQSFLLENGFFYLSVLQSFQSLTIINIIWWKQHTFFGKRRQAQKAWLQGLVFRKEMVVKKYQQGT